MKKNSSFRGTNRNRRVQFLLVNGDDPTRKVSDLNLIPVDKIKLIRESSSRAGRIEIWISGLEDQPIVYKGSIQDLLPNFDVVIPEDQRVVFEKLKATKK